MAAKVRRASANETVWALPRSHLIQPPSPPPAWSPTKRRRHPINSSAKVTSGSKLCRSRLSTSQRIGEIPKVKPRPGEAPSKTTIAGAVSSHIASTPSLAEMVSHSCKARSTTAITASGSNSPCSTMVESTSPSSHSVTKNGIPSTGSQPPVSTARNAGWLIAAISATPRRYSSRSCSSNPPPSAPNGKNRRSATVRPVSVSIARNSTPNSSWATMS